LGGPLVGGVLVQYLDWRWIFYVNIPIGLVSSFLTYWVLTPLRLPKLQGVPLANLDYLGSLLVLVRFACSCWG
jgi:MFS family permease